LDDQIGAVAHITFVPGAVRGDHIHSQTTQWNFIVSGQIEFAVVAPDQTRSDFVAIPGDLVCLEPGEEHALRALTDAHMMVFTMGPRAGKEYESDTIRLEKSLFES
jgi:quercetin dioxygenase-like cupin family protein